MIVCVCILILCGFSSNSKIIKHKIINKMETSETSSKDDQTTSEPIYIRLPRSGTRCPYTGLSRSKLNALILPGERNGYRPPVKSVSLRSKGALKGARLIFLESLLQHLAQFGEENNQLSA